MKSLDFGRFSVKEIIHQLSDENLAEWEKSILDFLKLWHSKPDVFLFQTSGSTGTPKSISFSPKDLINSAQRTIHFFDLKPSDSALLALPMAYVAGKMMLVRAIIGHLNLWIIEPKIDLSPTLTNFHQKIDFVALTPMQVQASIPVLSIFKTIILGGASVSEGLKEKLQSLSIQAFETYGMTETLTHVALKKISPEAQTYFQGLKGIHFHVNDSGCLEIKSSELPKNITTTDVVELWSDNQFVWKGRNDFVINSGGLKIHPEMVEKELQKIIHLPFYISAISDEIAGELPVLIIEGEEEIPELVEQIKLLNLKPLEQPRKIFYRKKMDRTESGKIIRHGIENI